MNRQGQALFFGLIAVVLVVALVAVFSGNRLLSAVTIGEEGYEPYDPQLAGNTYDPAKWIVTRGSPDSPSLAVKDGKLVQTAVPRPYAYDDTQPTLRTTDLRLIDFRTEFTLFPGGKDGGTVCWYTYCFTSTVGREDRRPKSPVTTLDLRWDDYELGHYQLFVNNQLVQEGKVPEGTPFYLTSTPTSTYGTEWWLRGELALSNPRVKRLFGCDLQEGEVKVHTCHAGPAVIELADLEGFERFCPTLPATFTDAGVAAASKRVYYSLAQGKPVPLQANQAWEFHYIASSERMNTPADKTGLVELCEGPIIIEALKDFPVQEPTLQGGTLSWSSYGRYDGPAGWKTKKTDLMSGDVVFMRTSPVEIDEDACPYLEASQSYPGLPASCFTVEAFGEPFHEGDTVAVSEGLNVTLEDLNVQYRLDDDRKVYTWVARWKLNFAPTAVAATLQILPEHNDEEITDVLVTSTLPKASYLVTADVRQVATGEKLQIIKPVIVGQGTGTLPIELPTDTIGQHDVTSWPSLQTEYGGIAFAAAKASYTVTAQASDTNLPADTGRSWWDALWDWIKALFSF